MRNWSLAAVKIWLSYDRYGSGLSRVLSAADVAVEGWYFLDILQQSRADRMRNGPLSILN
jgi:hypothetical protein